MRDQYVMKLAGRLDIEPDRVRDAVGDGARATARPSRASRADARPRSQRPSIGASSTRCAGRCRRPELMSGRLDVALFADPLARTAFAGLTELPWHECLERASPEVAALLQRLAVEDLDDRGPTEELGNACSGQPRRGIKSASPHVDVET